MIKLLTVYINTADDFSGAISRLYWQVTYQDHPPGYRFTCSLSEIARKYVHSEEAIENLALGSSHAEIQCSSCNAMLRLGSRKDFPALFNGTERSKASAGCLPICGACQHILKEEKKAAFLKKFAAHLVNVRKRIGLSQVELAGKCEKDPQSIERVENEKVNPSIYYLYEMAQGMGVPLKELLDFTIE